MSFDAKFMRQDLSILLEHEYMVHTSKGKNIFTQIVSDISESITSYLR